jgi:transposase
MTSGELDRLELLWKRKVSLKQIAKELGYSVDGVMYWITKDRERFPARRHKPDERRLSILIPSIIAKKMTCEAAARELGVSTNTVRRRVRRYEAGLDEGAGG